MTKIKCRLISGQLDLILTIQVSARTYLQLPLRQWGAGNVHLLRTVFVSSLFVTRPKTFLQCFALGSHCDKAKHC